MEKRAWGGARPGAGRKKGSVKDGATGRKKIYQTASISGTPEEIERLKANAEVAGQSVSRYVISRLAAEAKGGASPLPLEMKDGKTDRGRGSKVIPCPSVN